MGVWLARGDEPGDSVEDGLDVDVTMAMAKDRVARLQLRRICPKPEFQDAPSLVGEVTGTRAARKVP